VIKFTASSADWRRKISMESGGAYEWVIFEAATRAAEWALRKNKELGLFVEIEDESIDDKSFSVLTYKVLTNAGLHGLADQQRQLVIEEYNIDLAEDIEIGKLINKLNKAAKRKVFCIAELVHIQDSPKPKKTPLACLNLGLYEEESAAKAKCKELNACIKDRRYVVKKIYVND
jgi:hypothetical protein